MPSASEPEELYAPPVPPGDLTVEAVNEVLRRCMEHEPVPVPVVVLHPETLPHALTDGTIKIVRSELMDPGRAIVVTDRALRLAVETLPLSRLLAPLADQG